MLPCLAQPVYALLGLGGVVGERPDSAVELIYPVVAFIAEGLLVLLLRDGDDFIFGLAVQFAVGQAGVVHRDVPRPVEDVDGGNVFVLLGGVGRAEPNAFCVERLRCGDGFVGFLDVAAVATPGKGDGKQACCGNTYNG